MGLDPLGLELETYSVPEVTEELRNQTGPAYRLSASVAAGKLKIHSPTRESLDEVAKNATLLGDQLSLSKADSGVLALALDLRREGMDPTIVSDDYAVQNVAESVHLAYQSLATWGIRQRFDWTYFCPACYRRYSGSQTEVCQVCGTKLKRKPLRRQNIR